MLPCQVTCGWVSGGRALCTADHRHGSPQGAYRRRRMQGGARTQGAGLDWPAEEQEAAACMCPCSRPSITRRAASADLNLPCIWCLLLRLLHTSPFVRARTASWCKPWGWGPRCRLPPLSSSRRTPPTSGRSGGGASCCCWRRCCCLLALLLPAGAAGAGAATAAAAAAAAAAALADTLLRCLLCALQLHQAQSGFVGAKGRWQGQERRRQRHRHWRRGASRRIAAR